MWTYKIDISLSECDHMAIKPTLKPSNINMAIWKEFQDKLWAFLKFEKKLLGAGLLEDRLMVSGNTMPSTIAVTTTEAKKKAPTPIKMIWVRLRPPSVCNKNIVSTLPFILYIFYLLIVSLNVSQTDNFRLLFILDLIKINFLLRKPKYKK